MLSTFCKNIVVLLRILQRIRTSTRDRYIDGYIDRRDLLEKLAHVFMEAEKSHDLHLPAGEPGNLVV